MGYSTSFEGAFKLDKPLKPEHRAYLQAFSETRRMSRNPELTRDLKDELRLAVGLDLGEEAGYFVGAYDDESHGQSHTLDILDYNKPPAGQPGLWCNWHPLTLDTCDGIAWNGSEKFYAYTAWLEYLIAHFLAPWGYKLSGEVRYQGEDEDDTGTIFAKDNMVEKVADTRTKGRPSWA